MDSSAYDLLGKGIHDPAPVIREQLVKGDLFKDSGGGTLYTAIGPYASHIYKLVKSEDEMRNLWSLREAWATLRASDWTVPLAYVCDDQASIIGHIMRKVHGADLASLAQGAKDIPLRHMIARVLHAMADAKAAGIFPMVEHGGNVFVHVGIGTLAVSVIDVDGSVPWSRDRTEAMMLQQLEMIFINFERHPFY